MTAPGRVSGTVSLRDSCRSLGAVSVMGPSLLSAKFCQIKHGLQVPKRTAEVPGGRPKAKFPGQRSHRPPVHATSSGGRRGHVGITVS